jgi:hypothetical protein
MDILLASLDSCYGRFASRGLMRHRFHPWHAATEQAVLISVLKQLLCEHVSDETEHSGTMIYRKDFVVRFQLVEFVASQRIQYAVRIQAADHASEFMT